MEPASAFTQYTFNYVSVGQASKNVPFWNSKLALQPGYAAFLYLISPVKRYSNTSRRCLAGSPQLFVLLQQQGHLLPV